MTEQGPFRPIDGGDALKLNDYAWNKVANMVFIEQPSGGMSATIRSYITRTVPLNDL